MAKTVLTVENVSKLYRLGELGTGTLSHDLNRWWSRVRGKEDPYKKIGDVNDRTKKTESEYVWALKDINFKVEQGEILSIIGANGAGKSTLLKILSKVTAPTTGRIRGKGKVSALLEVGTGFHQELTARDNIYLNGSILGMKKKEITKKLDEIVDFAGIELYLDTPVKRFSSGMTVRLGFAVAAHLQTDILIIDEVLAVGDAEFQQKCLGKMNDISSGEGKTVLFVSHNMTAVENLCQRGIVLKNGVSVYMGTAKESIDFYIENDLITKTHFSAKNKEEYLGNNAISITEAKIYTDAETGIIDVTSNVYFAITIINHTKVAELSIGFDLLDALGNVVFGSGFQADCAINKTTTLTCHIPKNLLNDGIYNIYFYCHTKTMSSLLNQRDLLVFEVKDTARTNGYLGKINGAVRPKLEWSIK